MSALPPALITLAPEGTPPLRLSGMESLFLDPLKREIPHCRLTMSELKDAWQMLHSFLEDLPQQQRIALYGRGAYGTLAVHALGKTRRICAAVIQSALVDPLSALALTETVPPDPRQPIAAQAYALAQDCVLEAIQSFTSPLLIAHGEEDETVPSSQADELFALMKAVHPNLASRLLLFPHEGHTFSPQAQEVFLRECRLFLSEHLGGEAQ